MEMSKQGREWMRQWHAINAGTAPPNWRENPPPPLAEITRYELDRIRRGIPPDEYDLVVPTDETAHPPERIRPSRREIPVERVVERLGTIARSRRMTRGMRQCDLARYAGLTRSIVQRIENGRAGTLDQLLLIARALGMDASAMLRAAMDVPADEREREVMPA